MTIAISATRRTRGSIYAQVVLGEDATDCTLSAKAVAQDGVEVPILVASGDEEGEWFLSLAPLSVTQTVTLTATSWDGSVTEEVTQKFNPLRTRLTAPVRSLVRRPGTSFLHLLSERGSLGVWDITVLRLVPAADGAEVCQGYANLIGAGVDAISGDVSIHLLDARGKDASTADWTCLDDGCAPLKGHPGFYLRHVEFSVRTGGGAGMLVVWVKPQEATLPAGFDALSPRDTAEMRESWRAISTPAAADDAYDAWFSSVHAATQIELAMEREGRFDRATMFSLVCVLRGATESRVRETVDSVLEQTYANFELILVNAAPDNQRLASVVRGIELADVRVRSVPLAADFGVAAATSEGIDAAAGDFVCLLGEGDLLAPDALFCLAQAIDDNPALDLIYTDEDVIDHGSHVQPRFKSDWDPDLLLSGNYTGSLMAVRKSLLGEMETMDRELDGAQGYHLALYASERADHITHLARVLYHARPSREAKTSTAETAAGLAALRDHLTATAPEATARPSNKVPGAFEVTYPLEEEPLVSFIILNRDHTSSLDRCLKSLREATDYDNYEVIIVENGSVDPATFEYYRSAEQEDARVHTIFWQGGGDFNEPVLVNFGVSRAKGDYLALVHNDVEATGAGWLRRLVSLCARDHTAAAAARLVRADETVESSGLHLSPAGPVAELRHCLAAGDVDPAQALLHGVTMASGACLVVDAQLFRQMGGLADAYPNRFADADLCLRLWGAGYRVVIDPQVTIVHHRPLVADEDIAPTSGDYCAVGHLWESWPFGQRASDPMVGPNVDGASAYRALVV